jgi:hypothetical protein
MLTKTKIALAGVLILGTASTALSTAAEAYDMRFGNGDTWVTIPDSSTDGSVGSPRSVYHPGIFGDTDIAKAYGFVASPSDKHLRTKAPRSIR